MLQDAREHFFAPLVLMQAGCEDPAGIVMTGSNTQGTMDSETEVWSLTLSEAPFRPR